MKKGILISVLVFSLMILSFGSMSIPRAFAQSVGEELRIGVLAFFTGPSAIWGLACKYTAMIGAEKINSEGGLLIDGVRHPIKLFMEDTTLDTKVARAATEKLIYNDKVKYIYGPVAANMTAPVQAVTEPAKVFIVAFSSYAPLFATDKQYTICGMVRPDHTALTIHKILMEKYKAKTVSLVTQNYSGGIAAMKLAEDAANKYGLKILAKETYETDTTDFFPVMGKVVKDNPDAIDLTISGSDAQAQGIKAARQLGYKGIMCSEATADVRTFNQIAGPYAEDFICIGSVTMPEMRTPAMADFMEKYKKLAGDWNDDAWYKIYAWDLLMETFKKAGAASIQNTDVFKAAMPKVSFKDPYIKGSQIMVKYIGKRTLGHSIMMGHPNAILQFKGGKMVPLEVVEIDD